MEWASRLSVERKYREKVECIENVERENEEKVELDNEERISGVHKQ